MAEDLQYMQASNVSVSNFVSVKLSNQINYHVWKAQMICLLESQLLRGIVERGFPMPGNKIKQYDSLVKGWIFSSIDERVLKNFIRFESARDVWKKLESFYEPEIHFTAGVTSPGFIYRKDFVQVPEIGNEDNLKRKRKLYDATIEGRWWKARSILKNHEYAATEVICENGNTMLHLAVEMSQNYFVENLLKFIKDKNDIETKNNNGRTALHIAAMVGNKYAAQLLVQKRKELLKILDYKAQSPLQSAYNNKKLNTYAYLLERSPVPSDLSRYPEAYQKNAVYLIVSAILGKQYDIASRLLEKHPEFAMRNDQILMAIAKTFPRDSGLLGSFIYPSLKNVCLKIVMRGSSLFHCDVVYNYSDILHRASTYKNTYCSCLGMFSKILLVPVAILYPIYELSCLLTLVIRFPFSMLYFILWKVLAMIVCPIKNVEKKKKEYSKAKKILTLICDQMGTTNNCYNEPILEAVRQDAYQVVDEILFRSPDTISSNDEEGHNVIQLAIKTRSEKVYNLVHHLIERVESYRSMKDSSKNNLLHLATRLAPSSVLSRTTGAALQLQRELQWCEEVEKFMLPLELVEENIYMETPTMLFNNEHNDLMKQGENWTKTTAESCSITAALIVTVVFAAAITVPGGSNQESGIPVFKKDIAFTIFAVSNAFSLFTAATALLLFLSILTTRFSQKDFLVSLPRKMIFGLFTLFLSTSSMIIAFGAILFLVFCDKRPWMLAPLIGFSSLPIFVIVAIKLPLLMDLARATYFPVFGKQSYLESCKTNRKNTIFMR